MIRSCRARTVETIFDTAAFERLLVPGMMYIASKFKCSCRAIRHDRLWRFHRRAIRNVCDEMDEENRRIGMTRKHTGQDSSSVRIAVFRYVAD